MSHQDFYEESVKKHTSASGHDAAYIVAIMRDDIFHSTLDWVPPGRFKTAALKAQKLLTAYRSDPEMAQYFPREAA